MSRPNLDLPRRMNAATYFVDANVEAGRGAETAIHDAGHGTAYTYNEVLACTNRTGHALRALGVRKEERVALLLSDSPEFAFSFFGAIKIGAVPVPLNTLLRPADYAYLMNDSRARVLVVSESLLPLIEPIADHLTDLKHIVVVGRPHTGQLRYGELLEAASPELAPALMSSDDACFWLYSSGTTAFPKGAVHLQHDMIVASECYARGVLRMDHDDRTYSVAKLFFAYGLGNALYFPFYAGAETILDPGKPDRVKAYEIIQRFRPTLFFSVPTGYAGMLNVPDAADRYDTSSLRLCISAGESLPAALYERWKARFGVEILDGIGSTEILHIFISNRPGRVRPGSTGQIVAGYEARVVDDSGRDLPDGHVGDLLISGDSICERYWNQHEATRATIQGRWIRTGDKYKRDRDGYFWYQGRGDDMLKVGGIWVSPVEIENILIQHPAVLECAVVGTTDAAGLVKPKAYVVLGDGVADAAPASQAARARLADELRDFVKARIAAYKSPRWIEFVRRLPKTATGKTQRYRLRAGSIGLSPPLSADTSTPGSTRGSQE